jgi:hypothetical protein
MTNGIKEENKDICDSCGKTIEKRVALVPNHMFPFLQERVHLKMCTLCTWNEYEKYTMRVPNVVKQPRTRSKKDGSPPDRFLEYVEEHILPND